MTLETQPEAQLEAPPTANGKQVLVYSKPDCTACTNTKRWLTDRAIPYLDLDITSPTGLARAKMFGVLAAPMVLVQPAGTPISEPSDLTPDSTAGGAADALHDPMPEHGVVFSGFRPDALGAEFPAAEFPIAEASSPAATDSGVIAA